MSLSDLLVLHSSPTLAGIKSASLVSLSGLTARTAFPRRAMEEKGLSFWTIRNSRNAVLLLVYREKQIRKIMEDDDVQMILGPLGYAEDVQGCLIRLRERFRSECPHEIGLFLGYPPCDVRGFIENHGKGFVRSGMWKVYGNAEHAAWLSARWEACRRSYEAAYRRGIGIEKLCVSA